MAFRLLLVLLATCSLTALAHSDDDFAEFDDEEGEFDFDMPGELTVFPRKVRGISSTCTYKTCINLQKRG